ncbi:MAG TPA: hypothetical protein VGG06_02400, partial [Thermoanaerobaculia bacterium]
RSPPGSRIARSRAGPAPGSGGDEARVALGQIVSESYFDVFGVAPVHGRFFAPEEGEGLGAHPVEEHDSASLLAASVIRLSSSSLRTSL